MTVGRLLFAANRGFAADIEHLRVIMALIANLNRRPYAKGLPSTVVVHTFRLKHLDLTFRDAESKDCAKLHAENFEHIDRLFSILQEICMRNMTIYATLDPLSGRWTKSVLTVNMVVKEKCSQIQQVIREGCVRFQRAQEVAII